MERIEDLCHPEAPQAQYRNLTVAGRAYVDAWLPALPVPLWTLRTRLADAWAVWKGRATAVQWPHQRSASPSGEQAMSQQQDTGVVQKIEQTAKECEGRATFQHNVTGANPERVSDWLDEIEAQMDETSPYYLPRLIAEIRRLQAEQRGAQPSSAPSRADAISRDAK